MKEKRVLLFLIIILSLLFGQAKAAGLVPCGGEGEPACQFCHFFVMLNEILKFGITYIIPPIAILLIVWGGAQILLAGGSPGLLKKGKETIIWVAVGVAVILGAWIIVNIFFTFIGVAGWTGLREGWFEIDCPIE